MKKLNLKLDGIRERLTKEQMKKVTGGSSGSEGGGGEGGTHKECWFYCCPDTGSCSGATHTSLTMDCTSNEGCQTYGNANTVVSCQSGSYLAALCKTVPNP